MGIRSNIVSSGPLNTLSKKAIPFSHRKDEQWNMGSVMTWNPDDSSPTAWAALALMSDIFSATTGEIVHVDGGFHSSGM
jgi:enoyl-[acyl-carrier protein] reductase I